MRAGRLLFSVSCLATCLFAAETATAPFDIAKDKYGTPVDDPRLERVKEWKLTFNLPDKQKIREAFSDKVQDEIGKLNTFKDVRTYLISNAPTNFVYTIIAHRFCRKKLKEDGIIKDGGGGGAKLVRRGDDGDKIRRRVFLCLKDLFMRLSNTPTLYGKDGKRMRCVTKDNYGDYKNPLKYRRLYRKVLKAYGYKRKDMLTAYKANKKTFIKAMLEVTEKSEFVAPK